MANNTLPPLQSDERAAAVSAFAKLSALNPVLGLVPVYANNSDNGENISRLLIQAEQKVYAKVLLERWHMNSIDNE